MIPTFDVQTLESFRSFLAEKPLKIVVTTHHKPDGDAIGSSVGLAGILRRMGHTVAIVAPSESPDFLSWIEGFSTIIDFIRTPDAGRQALQEADLICCLDFNDPSRVEGMKEALLAAPARRMLLDHHLDPKDFCEFTFSDSRIGSTSELVIHLATALGQAHQIERGEAEALYTGIMTDTGSFRFSTVSPDTHRAVALLLEAGARPAFIHERVYDTNSESRTRFLGHCLLNRMKVIEEYHTVVFFIYKTDMEHFKHEPGDLEGIVNYGLGIRNMRMSALFSERDGIVKISFRSKGEFSVKELSEKHFSGGGHKNAAGGRSDLSLDESVHKFIGLLPDYAAGLK